MATRKTPTLDPEIENTIDEEELEEEFEQEMTPDFSASMTRAIPKEAKKDETLRVPVFLPKLDDPGDGGIKVDQYEHVTIANLAGEKHDRVLRGERVEVSLPTVEQLYQKYGGKNI